MAPAKPKVPTAIIHNKKIAESNKRWLEKKSTPSMDSKRTPFGRGYGRTSTQL